MAEEGGNPQSLAATPPWEWAPFARRCAPDRTMRAGSDTTRRSCSRPRGATRRRFYVCKPSVTTRVSSARVISSAESRLSLDFSRHSPMDRIWSPSARPAPHSPPPALAWMQRVDGARDRQHHRARPAAMARVVRDAFRVEDREGLRQRRRPPGTGPRGASESLLVASVKPQQKRPIWRNSFRTIDLALSGSRRRLRPFARFFGLQRQLDVTRRCHSARRPSSARCTRHVPRGLSQSKQGRRQTSSVAGLPIRVGSGPTIDRRHREHVQAPGHSGAESAGTAGPLPDRAAAPHESPVVSGRCKRNARRRRQFPEERQSRLHHARPGIGQFGTRR